jgi:hypothetical protein
MEDFRDLEQTAETGGRKSFNSFVEDPRASAHKSQSRALRRRYQFSFRVGNNHAERLSRERNATLTGSIFLCCTPPRVPALKNGSVSATLFESQPAHVKFQEMAKLDCEKTECEHGWSRILNLARQRSSR